MTHRPFFVGRGDRPATRAALPTVDIDALRDPASYRASPELAAAVDVALTLGMPLLLTGEPGSGKSGLADRLAWELRLGEVLRFVVKSDTESRDLFYRFDTVGRFHAAQTLKETDAGADPARFIAFEPLGHAILLAKDKSASQALGLPEYAFKHPGEPRRSVVLIDEIDKAPRDVPNDILVEIERMQFQIPELSGAGRPVVRVALDKADNACRPIVVFTSNSEKALPDPFLRRCVYHHLEFPPFESKPGDQGPPVPEDAVTVESIVLARLGNRYRGDDQACARVADAVGFFRHLRLERTGLERRPTLAEILDWLDFLLPEDRPIAERTALAALGAPGAAEAEARLAAAIKGLLLKKPADQARLGQLLKDWRDSRR